MISGDWEGMRIPDWLKQYHMTIVSNLPSVEILEQYTVYHDCGKHLVQEVDEEGRYHYPDHANASADYWKQNGGGGEVEELIRNDMFFHTCSAKDLEESELGTKVLCTLLITSLAEIHANAELFGGIESQSFKIKYKRIASRGKKFCKEHFGDDFKGHTYAFVRNDLPDSQKAVQAGHAVLEAERRFKTKRHPSLVYLKVKNQKKLKSVIKELTSYGINCTIFRDELFDNEITAVATEPLFEQDKRDLISRYSLL